MVCMHTCHAMLCITTLTNKQTNPLTCHATPRHRTYRNISVSGGGSFFLFYFYFLSLLPVLPPPPGEEILVCMNVNMTMTMTQHRATCNVTTQDIRTGEKGGEIRRPL